jgi:hypothetical protein
MYENMSSGLLCLLGRAHLNAQLKNAAALTQHSKTRHNHRDVTCC